MSSGAPAGIDKTSDTARGASDNQSPSDGITTETIQPDSGGSSPETSTQRLFLVRTIPPHRRRLSAPPGTSRPPQNQAPGDESLRRTQLSTAFSMLSAVDRAGIINSFIPPSSVNVVRPDILCPPTPTGAPAPGAFIFTEAKENCIIPSLSGGDRYDVAHHPAYIRLASHGHHLPLAIFLTRSMEKVFLELQSFPKTTGIDLNSLDLCIELVLSIRFECLKCFKCVGFSLQEEYSLQLEVGNVPDVILPAKHASHIGSY
ncbi:hypothetical protein HYPSUDRAFT_209544 [Hypholoma sublateritium FD-334 SS-4]|uniref:Uncharacterized protein n=1 Tax=Hypholoma sublateritium (strain FD-334 SS-4) TaxID=945553 RepID=A0A0D2N9Z2_HYPSF|nr:hypothetical protein HYPSUDRAFT_209544 [Hypholoma sublateritium FD-334 SS-4]